jgi:hypothetical protein
MNEQDNKYRLIQDDRLIRDADTYFGGGQSGAPAAPAAPAPAAKPAAQPEAPPSTSISDVPATSAAIEASAGGPAPPMDSYGEPPLVGKAQEAQTRAFPDRLNAAVKDMGWGLLTAYPQFAIGGRLDFYKHAYGVASDLGDWFEKVAPGMFDAEAGQQQKDTVKTLQDQYGQPALSQMFENLIPDPKTTTGEVFRKAGEFMAGFRLPFGMLKTVMGGKTAGVAASAISGFLSSPDEKGLGNLLAQIPGEVGEAAQALATNPNDPAIVNRLRHAGEQAGLGVMAEGLTKAVQTYAAARLAANTAAAETPEALQKAATAAQANIDLVKAAAPAADAQAPLFTLVEQPAKEALAANKLQEVKMAVEPGVPGSVLAQAISKAETMPGLHLNYANITKDNLPDMAQQIGHSIQDRISAAKRGVIPVDVTKELADSLAMTPEDMLAKPLGEAWNNEKIYGAAMIFGQATADLKAAAAKVMVPGSSLADEFALRRQLTYHAALQESFLGVAGEAGRALNIFNEIHASGMLRQGRAIQDIVKAGGGSDNIRALAEVIANSDNFSMSLAARKGWKATGSEAIRTVQVMNMLMRPATQVRNIVGNTGMLVQAAADIKYAQKLGYLFGTPVEEAISQAGANAYIDAHIYGAMNAFSMAGKAFKEGKSQFGKAVVGGGATATEGDLVSGGSKMLGHNMDTLRPSERYGAERSWSDEQIKEFTQSGFGRMMDYSIAGVTSPGRFLTSADDLFKSLTYSAKARQGAADDAIRQGLTGKDFENYVTAKTIDVPDHIHLDAGDWAKWATFNNDPGPITSKLMAIREVFAPASYIPFPFLRTPGNMAAMSIQHSPLAPVTAGFRRDVAAGGVVRDLALAKMATGSAMLSVMIALAEGGTLMSNERIDPEVSKLLGAHIVSGLPNDPALADAYIGLGVQKYSLRVGDKWLAISGLGQLAPPLAMAGDISEIWRTKDIRPDMYSRWGQALGLGVSSIYGSMKDQSYFQGFAQLMHMMDEGARGHEGAIETYLYNTLGTATVNMVPFLGGAMITTQKMWEPDPPYRQVMSWWDGVKQHVWGLADTVGPVRDRLGDIMPPTTWSGEKFGRLYDYFSPFPITEFKRNPLREELVRLQSGLQRIPKVDSFDRVKVDFTNHPEVFDMYQRLAGNEAKDPATGLGFKDNMSAIIKGGNPMLEAQHEFYKTLMDSQGETAPGTKMAYIHSEAQRFKQMAQEQIMADAPKNWPAFADEVTKERQRRDTFETGRGGIIAPIQDWGMKMGMQPTLEQNYTREPPKAKPNGSGGAGFTVPTGQ